MNARSQYKQAKKDLRKAKRKNFFDKSTFIAGSSNVARKKQLQSNVKKANSKFEKASYNLTDKQAKFAYDNKLKKTGDKTKARKAEMNVYKKCITKNKCPYCAQRKFMKGFNDLNSVLPNFVMNHWDFERNKNLISPDEIFKSSKRYAYFKGFENKKKIATQVQNYTRRLKRRNLEIR